MEKATEISSFIGKLAGIYAQIAAARARSPVAASAITLVAASKQQADSALRLAMEGGITHFGENRVQEAMEKWPALKMEFPELTLHLIGPLQTNKVKEAVALFDVIETLDREKLCDALAAEMEKTGRSIPFLVQVNTGEEEQKAGVAPEQADALIAYAKQKGLRIEGLMCVPPSHENPAPHFALLNQIAKRNGLTTLSMGMSGDYETAVRLGATHVRLGTVLFGERG